VHVRIKLNLSSLYTLHFTVPRWVFSSQVAVQNTEQMNSVKSPDWEADLSYLTLNQEFKSLNKTYVDYIYNKIHSHTFETRNALFTFSLNHQIIRAQSSEHKVIWRLQKSMHSVCAAGHAGQQRGEFTYFGRLFHKRRIFVWLITKQSLSNSGPVQSPKTCNTALPHHECEKGNWTNILKVSFRSAVLTAETERVCGHEQGTKPGHHSQMGRCSSVITPPMCGYWIASCVTVSRRCLLDFNYTSTPQFAR